jgi:hypothetical protein
VEERHLTGMALAARTGISPAYAQQIIGGVKHKVGPDVALRIAAAFGECKACWLRAAGYGAIVDAVRELRVLTHPFGLTCEAEADSADSAEMTLSVTDHSMAPTIPLGALLRARPSDGPHEPGVVVVCLVDGRHRVRRLMKRHEALFLTADNPAKTSFPDVALNSVRIVGPVTQVSICRVSEL